MNPFSVQAFKGVVDWAIVSDKDLAWGDLGLVSRLETWARLAVSMHGATDIIVMRDDFEHRVIYVATKKERNDEHTD